MRLLYAALSLAEVWHGFSDVDTLDSASMCSVPETISASSTYLLVIFTLIFNAITVNSQLSTTTTSTNSPLSCIIIQDASTNIMLQEAYRQNGTAAVSWQECTQMPTQTATPLSVKIRRPIYSRSARHLEKRQEVQISSYLATYL